MQSLKARAWLTVVNEMAKLGSLWNQGKPRAVRG